MVTAKEIAEQTGRNLSTVLMILGRKGIAPVEVHGRMKLYDNNAVELVGKPVPRLTDEQRKESHRKAAKKYNAVKRPAAYYKVSVKNDFGWWCVRACSLTRAESFGISKELNALGIEARAKPHSYGIRK